MGIFTYDGRRKKRIRHLDGSESEENISVGASSPDPIRKNYNTKIWEESLWKPKQYIGKDHTEKSTNLAFRQEAVLEGLSIQELMQFSEERAKELGDEKWKAYDSS